MRKGNRLTAGAVQIPESWQAIILVFVGGALAAIIGTGALTPGGHTAVGNTLLWIGTATMILSFGVTLLVFLRIWRPPGVTEREW